MTPSTRASRKIFFAKFDATGDLALLRHPKVLLMLGQLVVASKRVENKYLDVVLACVDSSTQTALVAGVARMSAAGVPHKNVFGEVFRWVT